MRPRPCVLQPTHPDLLETVILEAVGLLPDEGAFVTIYTPIPIDRLLIAGIAVAVARGECGYAVFASPTANV
jgi:hypothetical protein